MTRFKNTATQVVVNVPEEKGKRLGPEWVAVDAKPTTKARSKKTVESE